MRIPLLEGRLINEHDNADGAAIVVINETMARRFWPDRSAVGAQINIDDNNTGFRRVEIVGVVGNVKHMSLDGDPTSDIYLPFAQLHGDNAGSIANSFYLLVRSKTSSGALEKTFRRELKNVASDAAASNFKALEDFLSDSVAPRRFNLRVLTIFSAVALLLAATGIYGIVSYAVSRLTAEIGIRLALGAQRSNIFRLVLRQGLKVAVTGVGSGALGSIAMTRAIRSLLFGVTPTDMLTYVLVSALLVLVAFIACSVPARRATQVNPMVALRKE